MINIGSEFSDIGQHHKDTDRRFMNNIYIVLIISERLEVHWCGKCMNIFLIH